VWDVEAPGTDRDVEMVMWPPGAPFDDRRPWAELWLCGACTPRAAEVFAALHVRSIAPGVSLHVAGLYPLRSASPERDAPG
jgi:hypothetical protein